MRLIPQLLILITFLLDLSSGHVESSIDILTQSHDSIPPITALFPPLTDLLSTLATLQRKPTCYRTAATSLIHHCKSLSSDIPDPDRIQFAIKLTICELDLIGQTPSTCRLETQWKECVKGLATRDNWWTTFSGNLREVTNVCWIGRKEVEKGLYTVYCVLKKINCWNCIRI
jgi:hypothetical protein